MALQERIWRSREDMLRFLENAPVVIPEEGIIAGFNKADYTGVRALYKDDPQLTTGDNMHFPMGTSFLQLGFGGVSREAEKNMASSKTLEENETLKAISHVYAAVSAFIGRYRRD